MWFYGVSVFATTLAVPFLYFLRGFPNSLEKAIKAEMENLLSMEKEVMSLLPK